LIGFVVIVSWAIQLGIVVVGPSIASIPVVLQICGFFLGEAIVVCYY